MGFFKADAVIVKEIMKTGVRIIFYDRETIYVYNGKDEWTAFHRWYAPKGSYNGGWRQFRHLLLYEKQLTYRHCYKIAFRYDILSQVVPRAPDLSGFKIEERICV